MYQVVVKYNYKNMLHGIDVLRSLLMTGDDQEAKLKITD